MALGPLLAKISSYLFLITMMLSIGLETTARDVLAAVKNYGLMGRALLANLILVPILGVIIVRLFHMQPEVAAGFLLLAAAPGAPFAIQFTRRYPGSLSFAAGLLFVLSLAAVVLTPAIAGLLIPYNTPIRLPVLSYIGRLVLFLLVPLLIGFAIHRWKPGVATVLRKPVLVTATILFPASVILAIGTTGAAKKAIGQSTVEAMFILIIGSMIIGYLLGGPDPGNRRVLAHGTSMRNVAICLLIAYTNYSDTAVPIVIAAFAGVMIFPNVLFFLYEAILSKWRQRLTHHPAAQA